MRSDAPRSGPTLAGWITVLLFTAVALWVRLSSIDFALPYFQESDGHVFRQVHLLGLDELTPELIKESSIYPHLLPRIATAFPDALANPPGQDASLEEHLAFAGGQHVLVRSIVAAASVLMVPATWLLALRLFSPGWSLFAAALSALSLLNLQFGQMARPHAFAAPFMVLAVAAAVRLRRKPDAMGYVWCGLTGGLAVAALQSGVAVLFPFWAAFFLRDKPDRRWLEWKLIIPIVLMAACVWFFWPFAFVDVPGAETGVQDGTIRVSDQTMAFSEFTGEGFTTVFLTIWYYESVSFLLGLLGLIACVAYPFLKAANRVNVRRPGQGRDLLVILAFALPYLLTIGMHERAQQRFVIPLIPFAALLATSGLSSFVRLFGGGVRFARVAGALALAVPLAATAAYARLHEMQHTQGAASEWLEEHASPDDSIGAHLTYDLPLARRHENLFVNGDFGGVRRPGIFSGWQHHQVTHLGPEWGGQRWNIESLYVPAETDMAAVQADPEAWLRVKGYKYVVVPGEHAASFHPMMVKVRLAAANIGTLMLRAPGTGWFGERMRVKTKHEGLDTPHFTAFILTAPRLGPGLEIYRIDPPGAKSESEPELGQGE